MSVWKGRLRRRGGRSGRRGLRRFAWLSLGECVLRLAGAFFLLLRRSTAKGDCAKGELGNSH